MLVNRALVVSGFARDQAIDKLSVRGKLSVPRIFKRGDKTPAIIIAQELVVVVLVGQAHTLFGQHAAKEFQVQRLIVDNHPVEVEDDGSKHRF